MLNENDVDFEYREYTESPLTEKEIREVLKALDKSAHDLLRSRDAKKFDIDKSIDEDALVKAMSKEPTLLQRPILLKKSGKKIEARLGRPAETIAELF